MRELIFYEFKKLIKSKLNIFLIILSIISTTFLFKVSISQMSTADKNGDIIRNGFTSNQVFLIEKNNYKSLPSYLNDKSAIDIIQSYQDLFSSKENTITDDEGNIKLKENIYNSKVIPFFHYLRLIDDVYKKPGKEDIYLNEIKKVDLEKEKSFSESINKKIDYVLNDLFKDSNRSSQTKKQYWLNKIGNRTNEYKIGYHSGWSNFLGTFELLNLAIIFICMTLTGVFARESQLGTDNIIMTSKLGKKKLSKAKIISSIIFVSLVFVLNLLVVMCINFGASGFDGWNLPIQNMNLISPYNMNFLTATIITIITGFVYLIGMSTFILFLSEKLKKTSVVMSIVILIFLISMFMSISSWDGLWTHIYLCMPYSIMLETFSESMLGYTLYSFFGVVINIVWMRIIVYAVLILLSIVMTIRTYKKHQCIN
ncbi:MAG: hypothetical protein LBR30_05125 [Clostridioides sp.]|nr:hypothetical protein [Clostridioides sp.]